MFFFGTVVGMLILISLTAITDRLLLQHVNWQTNLFFMSIMILLAYTIIKKPVKLKESVVLFKKHPMSTAFTVLNVASTVFILLAIAIPEALVALVIPLRRTSTLFTSIFGGLLFHRNRNVVSSTCLMKLSGTYVLLHM